MKQFLCVIIVCSAINLVVAKSFEKGFETYGNVTQFLPAFVAIYPLAIQDWEGLGWLTVSTSSTLATIFIVKYSFYGIAKHNENVVRIAQRPNNGSFEGFPSGHTASAFSAAGFAQKRYGNALGIPCLVLAALTGFSRVVAEKHTIFQVLGGAILGYVMGYFITQRDISVSLSLGESYTNQFDLQRFNNTYNYSIQISYRF